MDNQATTSIKHKNQILTLKWKIICINITKYTIVGLLINRVSSGREPRVYKLKR